MDLETAKRLNEEFWNERFGIDQADSDRCSEAERMRNAHNRREALGLFIKVWPEDVQATFEDICEKQPIVRLGQGEYERRIYE